MDNPEIKIDSNNVTITLPENTFDNMSKMECYMMGAADVLKRLKPIVENGREAKMMNSFPRWGYTYESLLTGLEDFIKSYNLIED